MILDRLASSSLSDHTSRLSNVLALCCYVVLLKFFTTMPLACDPSSLPRYPRSKELDAKPRNEEITRRKRAAGEQLPTSEAGRPQGRRNDSSKAVPARDANAELPTSDLQKRRIDVYAAESISEKFVSPRKNTSVDSRRILAQTSIDANNINKSSDRPTHIQSDMNNSRPSSLSGPLLTAGPALWKGPKDEEENIVRLTAPYNKPAATLISTKAEIAPLDSQPQAAAAAGHVQTTSADLSQLSSLVAARHGANIAASDRDSRGRFIITRPVITDANASRRELLNAAIMKNISESAFHKEDGHGTRTLQRANTFTEKERGLKALKATDTTYQSHEYRMNGEYRPEPRTTKGIRHGYASHSERMTHSGPFARTASCRTDRIVDDIEELLEGHEWKIPEIGRRSDNHEAAGKDTTNSHRPELEDNSTDMMSDDLDF